MGDRSDIQARLRSGGTISKNECEMFELAADGLRFELWGKETRSWPGPGADGSDRSSFSTGERWIYRHLILELAGRHDGTGERKTDRRLPPLRSQRDSGGDRGPVASASPGARRTWRRGRIGGERPPSG